MLGAILVVECGLLLYASNTGFIILDQLSVFFNFIYFIILFCPTGNSDFNKIYTTLESIDQENDIRLDYSDDKILEILDNIANEEKDIKDYYKYQKAYNKFKNNEKLKDKHLLILDKHDFKDPFIDLKLINQNIHNIELIF